MSSSVRLSLLALACAVGLAVPLAPTTSYAASAPADDGAGVAQHSLRRALTNQDFYFVMGDRFANGSTANDKGGLGDDPLVSGFDPTGKGFYNGGDLRGLKSKLDYIQGLGTDAIWLTPIFKNKAVQPEDASAGYHGYWITDFTQVDPHLGTNADLTALVNAAHRRGMKVFFDIITNHTADVIGYSDGARTAYVSKDQRPYRTAAGTPFDDRDYAGTSTFPALNSSSSFPYTPVLDPAEADLKVPAWLNNVRLYHNRGNTTFTGEDSQYGDFFGLDDLFTERPRVVKGFERIYKTWVRDFGIDGFRIDTMKHVNDEFWQSFGPGLVRYAHRHGKPRFFMFGEVAFDGYDGGAKAFTSHYTTHDKMQSVLDFPFKDAARDFASRGLGNAALARFFVNDDWYTDANSNAYQLPTFLGNHDFGRLGFFLATDNPGARDSELLARDRLAHQLMYFSRGNPVIYYGDEQGFAGSGGDQLARQSMFASQVPEYQDDDLIGTDSTHAVDNFDTSHPLYRAIRRLARVTDRHPALRNGAQQVRYASADAGIFAFSRIDRGRRHEYVVALNNDQSAHSARVPTFIRNGNFRLRYGAGLSRVTTDGHRMLPVTVPGLSAVVYESTGRIPRSHRAPHLRLAKPVPSPESRGRMWVKARVRGSSFYEVTFQTKVGTGRWHSIGTDDSAPYRVFHDTSNLPTGTRLRYRAVVLDNAGHTVMSANRSARVPAPAIAIASPVDGGTVSNVDPVTVRATVDPERASESVRFQRSVAGGVWATIRTDRSSPDYTATDDVSALPLGTRLRYRAVLLEPGTPRVTSAPVRVTTAPPQPAREHVTLVGDLQSEAGCAADWDAACVETRLSFDTSDGQWHGTFALPAGDFEWKVAINNSFAENYGEGGALGGANLELAVPTGGASYVFTWNQITHVPSVAPAP